MEFVAFSKFYNFLTLIIMYIWINFIYLAFCVPALAMGAPAKQRAVLGLSKKCLRGKLCLPTLTTPAECGIFF